MTKISVKDQKILWSRAAGKCSICQKTLFFESSDADPVTIGEECHIIAKKNRGPRGSSVIKEIERNKYNNLILLCRNDHKLIDSDTRKYTVQELILIKEKHEKWVCESLNIDQIRQSNEEYYAWIIETWEKEANIENWSKWTSSIFYAGSPRMPIKISRQLDKLITQFITIKWPGLYQELETSLINFFTILTDFYKKFHKHAIKINNMLCTEKFYQSNDWNPSLYNKLSNEYLQHVELVQDLLLEMTRASNYVFGEVRKYILPSYRLKEGALLSIQIGPFEPDSSNDMPHFYWTSFSTQYSSKDIASGLYRGIKKFETDRFNRDICIRKIFSNRS